MAADSPLLFNAVSPACVFVGGRLRLTTITGLSSHWRI